MLTVLSNPGTIGSATLSGPDAGVTELQKALKAFSQAFNFPAGDPKKIDGYVGMDTTTALINTVPYVPKMPSEVAYGVDAAKFSLAVPAVRDKVFKLIREYAREIAAAVIAVQTAKTLTDKAPPGPQFPGGGGGLFPGNKLPALRTDKPPPSPSAQPSKTDVPQGSSNAIFYRSAWTGMYRVAMPRGQGVGAGGYVNYVEVSPSMSRPGAGVEVSRDTFMRATGKWWGTTVGIAGIVTGATAAVGGTIYLIARR